VEGLARGQVRERDRRRDLGDAVRRDMADVVDLVDLHVVTVTVRDELRLGEGNIDGAQGMCAVLVEHVVFLAGMRNNEAARGEDFGNWGDNRVERRCAARGRDDSAVLGRLRLALMLAAKAKAGVLVEAVDAENRVLVLDDIDLEAVAWVANDVSDVRL